MMDRPPEDEARVIFGRVEPIPEKFGIDGKTEINRFYERQAKRDIIIGRLKNFASLLFFILIIWILFSSNGYDISIVIISTIPILIALGAFRAIFPEKSINRFFMWRADDGWISNRVTAYEREKAEFDRFVLTAGLDFWRQLRGVALEQEAAAVFKQSGWQVSTTRVVADDGVDLILRNDEHEIWCQCKGYAKPVTVAPVREIAGVCVASGAKPMLLVVNGLTRPARAEASKLGVMVLDAGQMAELARGESKFMPFGQVE